MSDVIRATFDDVPIAAWMVQADPATFDVGSVIADPPEADEWDWVCERSPRTAVVAAGQPCFLWVAENENPALVAGIWLAGDALGPCSEWIDDEADSAAAGGADPDGSLLPDEPVLYIHMRLQALAAPIPRAVLLEHPVLRDLEVLTAPDTGNPLIVTQAQLDALRADFDLAPGVLTDDLRDALRAEHVPELWVMGPDEIDVEADTNEAGMWAVWVEGDEVSTHHSRAEAYAAAATQAAPDLPLSSDESGWVALAEHQATDGVASVFRFGPEEYLVLVELDDEDDDVTHQLGDAMATFAEAIAAIAAQIGED